VWWPDPGRGRQFAIGVLTAIYLAVCCFAGYRFRSDLIGVAIGSIIGGVVGFVVLMTAAAVMAVRERVVDSNNASNRASASPPAEKENPPDR